MKVTEYAAPSPAKLYDITGLTPEEMQSIRISLLRFSESSRPAQPQQAEALALHDATYDITKL